MAEPDSEFKRQMKELQKEIERQSKLDLADKSGGPGALNEAFEEYGLRYRPENEDDENEEDDLCPS